MQPNQTLEFFIDDLGVNGEGIAHSEGYTIFIPYALKGERVKAKLNYLKKSKSIAYADLKEVLEPSPDRRPPICNRFARCGGCALLHLAYPEQLKAKRLALVNTLRKNAGYTGEVDEVVPSDEEFGYRNKVQLPFGIVGGEIAVGFYHEKTRKVVSVTKCFLHGEWLERLVKAVLAYARQLKPSVYSNENGEGLLRHLVARMTGGKLCITLVVNGRSIPEPEALIALLDEEFTDYSLYLSPNTENTGVVMGDSLIPLKEGNPEVTVNGVKLKVNPFSFFQVNDSVRDKVYTRISEEVGGDANTLFVDAYAGVGLTGAPIAKAGAEVVNIEIVGEAVDDADLLYRANGLSSRVTNICGDAAEELIKLNSEFRNAIKGNRKLVIYVDPPRKGISEKVAETLNALAAEYPFKLIYLSCNPATLSRDLKLLTNFDVTRVTPYDMFPQTPHLEVMAVLSATQYSSALYGKK